MNYFLDIDYARNVFRLLFSCGIASDEASDCADKTEVQFEVLLENIMNGVRVSPEVRQKLFSLYVELLTDSEPIRVIAREVANDFRAQPEVLVDVLRMILRISSDDGMLFLNDRERVRDVLAEFLPEIENLQDLSALEQVMLSSCSRQSGFCSRTGALQEHFETLGCSADMTVNEIRSRYRKLVMKYHPDRSAVRGDTIDNRFHFERIQKAYQAISQLL